MGIGLRAITTGDEGRLDGCGDRCLCIGKLGSAAFDLLQYTMLRGVIEWTASLFDDHHMLTETERQQEDKGGDRFK